MSNARIQSGLNDFEYCASLHIEQRQLDPVAVSKALQLAPRRTHRAGDPRQTPNGTALPGVYQSGYWHADLLTRDGEDLAEFLSRIASELDPNKEFLRRIADEGGRIECFIGIFSNRGCDNLLPANVLRQLGQLGVGVRLDFYGPDKRMPSTPTQHEFETDEL